MAACATTLMADRYARTGRIAEQMIQAINEGNLPELSSELQTVRKLGQTNIDGPDDEQIEILSAIAEDLERRTKQGSFGFPCPSDVEVHLSLLRHLAARSSRLAARCRLA